MTKYTQEKLIEEGYKIENALIKNVSLTMKDNGCLTSWIILNGENWGCGYGGYCLGHGYLGSKKFDSAPSALEGIMMIMNVVGVEEWESLKGKYVRVATKGWGGSIKIIGNIVEDRWFDYESFYGDKEDK